MPAEMRLFRTYKDGRAHIEGFAEDYAFYANGLISLYEATFEPQWADRSRSDCKHAHRPLLGRQEGRLLFYRRLSRDLVARPKDLYDNAIPTANSVAAEALIRLYLLTAELAYEHYAVGAMRPVLEFVGRPHRVRTAAVCAGFLPGFGR